MEKGVIRRVRVRGEVIEGQISSDAIAIRRGEFASSPIPLTT
jgi:hypothetical protein